MHLLKKQLRWSWIILSKNGVLNIHMRYAHGEIIGKNWLCSLISLSGLERLSISLILLKIWMGRLESTPKISYHFRMIMRWKNLSIWPLTKSKRNGTNLFGIGHWYLTNLLLCTFVIVWSILFDYQRITFNSHENGQRIRKCRTVQNHYIPHAFK